jgi:hypothetical protein
VICKTWHEAWFHMDYFYERNFNEPGYDENRYEIIEALVASHWGLA